MIRRRRCVYSSESATATATARSLFAAHQCRDRGQRRLPCWKCIPACADPVTARDIAVTAATSPTAARSGDRRTGADAVCRSRGRAPPRRVPACTITPANGSTGSASAKSGVGGGMAALPARLGSAAIRRNSTSTATACAASRSARRCRRTTTCICSTQRRRPQQHHRRLRHWQQLVAARAGACR